ncbi:MAG: RND transporter, partial [Gemmatimonadota bacterium]|nr:RND transporter [Gemmatimonadota bacterium]
SAEVEIVLETVPEALSVPLGALFKRENGLVAFRLANGKFVEVPVVIGPKNATAAVVTAGLAAGDIVALQDPNAH